MDGLNRENNASRGSPPKEPQRNQKPLARSVEKKLKKLRARLAKKELEEKVDSTTHPPREVQHALESKDGMVVPR